MPTELVRPLSGAQIYWPYEPSSPRLGIVLRRWLARPTRRRAPAWKMLVPPATPGSWLLYFIYLPNGALLPQHRFTLERLAKENAQLMVVCACPSDHPVLKDLRQQCDALYWKDAGGFDFSGYAIGLSELAKRVPTSDVMVLNDSMLGPFLPLTPFIEQAPWRLTGLSASALEENHLQSFAFVVRNLNAEFLRAVEPVISTEWCYEDNGAVILLQETRLARAAGPHMTVGAYWYTDGSRYQDLCLNCPDQMLKAGFPLLKRSLFGKFSHRFQDPANMQALLRELGHPDSGNGPA